MAARRCGGLPSEAEVIVRAVKSGRWWPIEPPPLPPSMSAKSAPAKQTTPMIHTRRGKDSGRLRVFLSTDVSNAAGGRRFDPCFGSFRDPLMVEAVRDVKDVEMYGSGSPFAYNAGAFVSVGIGEHCPERWVTLTTTVPLMTSLSATAYS